MLRIASSIFAACTALTLATMPAPALAGKADFHLDTSAAAPRQLKVDSRWLNVQVHAIAENKVTVQADFTVSTSSDQRAQQCVETNKVRLETEGDTLVIRQGEKGSSSKGCNGSGTKLSGQMIIGVPANIPLHVNTASGSVDVKGNLGTAEVQISVASGDVALAGQVGSLELNSASGSADIAVEQPIKRLEASLASGDLRFKGGATEAKVTSASGNVELLNLSGSAHARTASGDIRLSWDRFAPGSRIEAEAISGEILLTLPAGIALQGRLESLSGSIHSDLPGKPGRERGVFVLEGKDGHIDVEAISGNINLRAR